jgi:hypothetical protein
MDKLQSEQQALLEHYEEEFGDVVTLADAQVVVHNHYTDKEGILCPCCSQQVRLYKYKLHSTLAAGLVDLVLKFGERDDWIHASEIAHGNNIGKAAHWGMIETKPNTDPTKRTSGLWKPTHHGANFVLDTSIRVPSHAFLFNAILIGWTDTTTNITEALGNRFDYQEMMDDE